MSWLTTAARTWLTGSSAPFLFTDENEESLDTALPGALGLYVHVPFCRRLCDFCPYCKVVYRRSEAAAYTEALLEEIRLVGEREAARREVSSVYFGGGTPALLAGEFSRLTSQLARYYEVRDGIGAELHPADVRPEVLGLLREAGVTRISIGIQSFLPEFASLLGRPAPSPEALAAVLREVPFETVSMDFIFALPSQTFLDLKADLDTAFQHGANHVAIYPFIDFSFASASIEPMSNREKRALLEAIMCYCRERGYIRDSIWTFSKGGRAKYSSMTRDVFLGFGCSATTLLTDQFKINTFSVEEYCRRIADEALPTSLTLRFTPRQRMVYYLFWTAYTTEVDAGAFEAFFGVPLKRMYGAELHIARLLGLITEEQGRYRMTLKGAFYYHHSENFYTLAYIDKMWGILRKEAFPEQLML